jgi:6-pyruvoyltetrahydropterin/6-carboxytetrahydropterin synthase
MKISQAFTFEAAHWLPNVPREHRCNRMHGHSYRVEIRIEGPVDPRSGFVVDFSDVEAAFGPLRERLDHHCLNEVEGLENPTAENIATWIWDQLRPSFRD